MCVRYKMMGSRAAVITRGSWPSSHVASHHEKPFTHKRPKGFLLCKFSSSADEPQVSGSHMVSQSLCCKYIDKVHTMLNLIHSL